MATITKVGRAYEVKWSWYVDNDTRRFKRQRFSTLDKAKAKKREVEDQVASGAVPDFDAPKRRVREFGAEWLALKEGSLKPSTFRSYRLIWESSVEPWFGGMRVSGVTIGEVEQFIASLSKPDDSGRTRSHVTIRHHVWVLRQVLKRAERVGAISRNPCDFVDNMPTQKSSGALPYEPNFLEAEQVEAIAQQLDTADPDAPWGLIVRFAAWTGLRAGEIAGLNVGDVDLLRRTVTVRRTRQKRTREWVEHTPKSGKKRVVPLMTDWLVDDLRAYLAGHPNATDPDAPLFPGTRPGANGGSPKTNSQRSGQLDWSSPWEPGTFVRRRFRPAVSAAGVMTESGGGVRFHDLRHTFASLAASKGIPSAQVAAWMGHANDVITRQVYTHLFEDDSARWAAQMGAGARPVATGHPDNVTRMSATR